MAAGGPARQFDQLSGVYDETRTPLEPVVADTIAATLKDWGVRAVLEVGVGTGRVALPLIDRGLRLTGVDASGGMLARARAKGIDRLVLGSAYRLPFTPGAFDATLFVHVLHILDEPRQAIREGCRVARLGAVALVRPSPPQGDGEPGRLSPRRMVVERLRQDGVPVPDRAGGGPPVLERQLLAEVPPDRLVTVDERNITERLADQLSLFERRASRWTLDVPPERLARAVAEARDAAGERTYTYHQVLALALWRQPPATAERSAPRHTPDPRPREA